MPICDKLHVSNAFQKLKFILINVRLNIFVFCFVAYFFHEYIADLK